MHGFMGKILLVNLSEKKIKILNRNEAYYKKIPWWIISSPII